MDNEAKSAHEYLSWLNGIAAATFVINAEHKVTYWNHACEVLTSVKAGDVIGTNKHWLGFYGSERACLVDLVLNDDWESNIELYSHIKKAQNSDRGLVARNWCKTPAGDKYLIFEANAFFDEEGNLGGAIETLRDATDLKQMETELRLAQKLESVGQLAAGIAHEINTPTQYLSDNLQFLSEGFSNISRFIAEFNGLLEATVNKSVTDDLLIQVTNSIEDTDRDYFLEEIPVALKQSQEGIENISKIVRAMKEFSHPGSDDKEHFDINRIIKNAATVTGNEWKLVADMEFDLDEQLPTVPCYAQELGHVFMNLIVNASHALTDALDPESSERGKIRISSENGGDVIKIKVSDTGPGIPEAVLDKIFDPFFTTKEVGKGTGQGLSIAHSTVIDKHNGSLTCDSVEGTGTTFNIMIPMNDDTRVNAASR